MGCRKCGCPTQYRICRECELLERAEEAARHEPDTLPGDAECPECGGYTSGEGVICYKCR